MDRRGVRVAHDEDLSHNETGPMMKQKRRIVLPLVRSTDTDCLGILTRNLPELLDADRSVYFSIAAA